MDRFESLTGMWHTDSARERSDILTGSNSIITRLADLASRRNASDIHLRPRGYAYIRIDGSLKRVDNLPKFKASQLEELVFSMLTDDQLNALKSSGEIDFAINTSSGHRLRANGFYELGHIALALRLIKSQIPSLAELGLPPVVEQFAHLNQGLVILTGGTGSGKSTTIAALLEVVNNCYEKHIITIEDPVEYIFTPKQCIISQRELGIDLSSFAHATRSALREDPDVILLGEMRDAESIETALAAAETGHLVFSTVHAPSTAEIITRICAEMPAQSQANVRAKLSQNLQGIVAQRLIPRASGDGRVLACEIVKTSARIRDLILDPVGIDGINEIIRNSNIVSGIQSFDQHLIELYRSGAISKDNAIKYASFPVDMRLTLGV